MRWARATVAALAAAAALTGCGSHPATYGDVIARANAACQSAQSAIRALAPPRGASAAALAPYLTKLQPIVAREAQTIQKLPRPARQRSTLIAFQAAVGRVEQDYARATQAARSGDTAGLSAAFTSLRASQVATLARTYGMRVCAGGAATVR